MRILRPGFAVGCPVVLGISLLLGCGGAGSSSAPPPVPPAISAQPTNLSVNQGQAASFSVTATGTSPLNYQWQKNGTAISGATEGSYSIANAQATAVAAYTAVVTNVAGSATSSAATLSVNLPPAITSQPANLTVNQGQTASFSVTATGTAPLSYQWQKNGTAINGATGNSYSIASAQADDAGAYSVTVSNSLGSVASTAASLTVLPKPTIQAFTISPTLIPIGGTGVLSWTVTGATSLSVDQGVGSVALESGTKNVSPTATTTYTLTATNGAGSVTAKATLNVDATPFQITNFTASSNLVDFGGTSSLNWTYSGLPLSFTLDGAAVSGLSSHVAPVRRQTYTLAGSNGAASDTKTLKVAARGLDLLAGHTEGPGSMDGQGTAARFNRPNGIAVDTSGNLYVADEFNNVIRKVTMDGLVTTLAGSSGVSGSADGQGNAARFDHPSGLAVDSNGTIYVADAFNLTIRKMTPDGFVSTLAGTAGNQVGYADGPASAAIFGVLEGLAVDSGGNVYVADWYNRNIRKITPDGFVSTLAGSTGQTGGAPGESGSVDGQGALARFNGPGYVAVDASGNVYASDGGTIRKITPEGMVSTLAGTAGQSGSADGLGGLASFYSPCGIGVDGSGNLYVADLSQTIRKVTPGGLVSTLAGAPWLTGHVDGQGGQARFWFPNGLAVDAAGSIWVAEQTNSDIRKISPEGLVSTLAGSAWQIGSTDGQGSLATFEFPYGVAVARNGDVYTADTGNQIIRKVTPSGVATTVAGTAHEWGTDDGLCGAAKFSNPYGIAIDGSGNAYVADTSNNTIRKVTPNGLVSTLAGVAGQAGADDGPAGAAKFNTPYAIAVDGSGNLFVADTDNNAIRKITPEGLVSTLAGATGSGTPASFAGPSGVAVDGNGNVYVADTWDHLICKITPQGSIITLAGKMRERGSADGHGASASFNFPQGLAVDETGNVFVADTENHAIRKITPDGMVSTIAGVAGQGTFVPGTFPGHLVFPTGIALTPDGDLIVTCNNGIVQITAP